VLKNPEKREEMEEKGFEYAQKFNDAVIIESIYNLYI